MSIDVHIGGEYAPWSAEFTDGTYLSRLADNTLKFAEVIPKLPILHAFYIHFDYDKLAGVRMSDGKFYIGSKPGSATDWFCGPCSISYPVLIYSRRYGGTLTHGKLLSCLLGYTLGWSAGNISCKMLLDPQGNFTWSL